MVIMIEALVAILRPKQQGTWTTEFKAWLYDILLVEIPLSAKDKNHVLKQLPKCSVSFEDDAGECLLNYLYSLTGADQGGLKGKRCIYVPQSGDEPSSEVKDSSMKGSLFCIPVDSKVQLNPKFLDNSPSPPAFQSLDAVMAGLKANALNITRQSVFMLNRLQSWLKELHHTPGAVALLFSPPVESRIKISVKNPAHLTETSDSQSDLNNQYSSTRRTATEILTKMLALEKCDRYYRNPLYGSGLTYKNKVETHVVNKFWGRGIPDYTKIKAPQDDYSKNLPKEPSWVERYPLHKAAHEGDAKALKDLLKTRLNACEKDKNHWAPIHYAAWFGHLEAIQVLLNVGECSPNLSNREGATALHIAATCGHPYVIELLLSHPDIDVHCLDNAGKTALDRVGQNANKPDWEACQKLLKTAMNRPKQKIQVNLMDGTYRMLDLVSGSNTTVRQLQQQILSELHLSPRYGHLFTIWICSRSLQLQLKPEHKPTQHLYDWKRRTIGLFTDSNPAYEDDPQLFWRRDAKVNIYQEEKIRNAVAISLLFAEAYHNYINSMYPCADQDVGRLGGILMQLHHGDYQRTTAKTLLSNRRNLRDLVPISKLGNKHANWASKIETEYQRFTQSMSNKDRSPQKLQYHFLRICWNLIIYGSAFFTGYVQLKSHKHPTMVLVGVNDYGIHIIDGQNRVMLRSFEYREIEWHVREDKPCLLELELQQKQQKSAANKDKMNIMTKQNGLIYHLMKKLSPTQTG